MEEIVDACNCRVILAELTAAAELNNLPILAEYYRHVGDLLNDAISRQLLAIPTAAPHI